MQTLHAISVYLILGMPVWAWAGLAFVVITQDVLARSRFKSNSYVQLAGNIADRLRQTLLGRFPIVAQILGLFALGRTPAPADVPVVTPDARTKQSGMVVTGVMLVMALLGALALGVALAGCAHGADGLRQACATEKTAAATAFKTADAWYAPKLASFKSSTETRDQFTADTALYNRVRAAVKAAASGADAQCVLADSIDAGEKHDVLSLIATVGAFVVDIGDAIAQLPGAITSNPGAK